MSDKPMNWMDQAGSLFKQWTDQQETFFRGMARGAGTFNAATPSPTSAAVGMSEGLRRAQDLWQSSMEKWVDIAKQALPQSGITAESLKRLFDPSQWAQRGLGPLEQPSSISWKAQLRHPVDARPQDPQRPEAAYRMVKGSAVIRCLHGAWNEAVKRFLNESIPITSWREFTDSGSTSPTTRWSNPPHARISGGATPIDPLRCRMPFDGARNSGPSARFSKCPRVPGR